MVSQILTRPPGCPFLLKAHGGIQDGELTLTHDSYRTLMAKNPAYRAFVQNLLTNCSLVIVGFGMSDPDFDLFLATLANTFGGPLQRHVLIRHRKEQSSQEVILRRRFGIHTLYVDDYAQIPHVLQEASVHAGPALERLLRQSVESPELAGRALAHAELRKLGPTGRDCALAVLKRRAETERHPGLLAEVAYTIGVIDAASGKETLMKLVEESAHAAPAARALTVLRPVLGPQDLPRIAAWRDAFTARPLIGERIRRLPLFCEYLITYVQAKHDSDADLGSSQ